MRMSVSRVVGLIAVAVLCTGSGASSVNCGDREMFCSWSGPHCFGGTLSVQKCCPEHVGCCPKFQFGTSGNPPQQCVMAVTMDCCQTSGGGGD